MPGSAVSSLVSGSVADDSELNEFLAPSEAEDADSVQGKAKSRPRAQAAQRKVAFNLSKPCTCSLCNSKSTDKSPLHDAAANDKWAGNRPWAKYRSNVPDKDGTLVSVPEGKVCLLCINVFKLLSLHIKYGSYKAYSEKIKAKTVDHNEFLAALAEWIKSHNKDPQRSRMDQAQKAAVKKAQTQLKTMKSTGVEFEAPETFFVAQENWDAAKYGPLDESKVEERNLFGKVVKGAFVQTGLSGHYKVRDYDKRSLVSETTEHAGDQEMFNEQGLANAQSAIAATFHEAQQERRASAVAAKAPQSLDIDSILSLIQNPNNASTAAAKPATAEAGPSVPIPAEEGEQEKSSSEEDVAVADRLALTRKANAKAKAKGKTVAKAATGGSRISELPSPANVKGKSTPIPQSVGNTPNVPIKQEPTPASTEAENSGNMVVSMDGRGLRLKTTVAKSLEEHKRKLEPLLIFDKSYSWHDKKANSGRAKSLSSLKNHLSNLKKKVDESPNKKGLTEELNSVEEVISAVSAASVLNGELVSGTPKSEDMEQAIRELEQSFAQSTFKVSEAVWFRLLEIKCNEFMLYRNTAEYCQSFADDAPEARL